MAKIIKQKSLEPVGEPVNLVALAEENNNKNTVYNDHPEEFVQYILKHFDLLAWYAFESRKLAAIDVRANFLKFKSPVDAHNYLTEKNLVGTEWGVLQGHELMHKHGYQVSAIKNKIKNKKN